MKNLITKPQRREFTAYVDLKEPVGKFNTLRIDVEYYIGGMNYFSGNYNARGYRFSLKPCNVNPNGMEESILLGTSQRETGGFIMIEKTSRFSQKRLTELAEMIDDKIPEIAEAWRTEGPFLKMVLDVYKPSIADQEKIDKIGKSNGCTGLGRA